MAFMSVLVITASNPITSIIYLIGVFVMAACYLSCMGLSYIGLTYLVVYVGAVAVLFLFVVMMFNIQNIGVYGIELMQAMPLGAIIGGLFLMELMSVMPTLKTYLFVKLQSVIYAVQGLIFGVPTPMGALSNEAVNVVYSLPSPDSAFTYLSQLQSLGLTLYTYNALWLIIIGLVLLLSMMGPISLCLRINKS